MARTLVPPTLKTARRFARSASFIFTLALMTTASAASAGNAFLLQLGSSDTKALAWQKWDDIRSKNTDVLSGLSLHIAEVALPPDNVVSFRTQAGPVTSRVQADSLCSTLQSRSVECYVVETAFAAGTAPEPVADTLPENTTAPQPKEVASAAASKETVAEAQPKENTPVVQQPVVPAAPTLPKENTPAIQQPVAAAQPENHTTAPETPQPAAIASALPENAHVSEAAPATKENEETEAEDFAAERPSRRHVEDLSHSDDPDYVPPPVDSGVVMISSSGAYASQRVASNYSPPQPVTRRPARAASPETVAEAEPVTATPDKKMARYEPGREPQFLDNAAVAAASPSAPPPPAPAENVTPAPAPVAAAAPAAESTAESPGFFARLFGSSPPKPAAAQGVVGSVNVAEAVRVPLSSEDRPSRVKVIPIMPQQVRPLGGYPSESTARDFWAQVSYFRDEMQALTFYRQFSAAYPQFIEGVRIRITRPFTASTVNSRVSLRVGPFAGTDDVRAICYVASRWSARCTVVRDLGASAALGIASGHKGKTDEEPGYWAQLGTFRSEQEAWSAWNAFKKEHRSLTKHVRVSVTTPAQSSAPREVYRLRAGTFKSEGRANTFCDRLEKAGEGCAVVNDR